MSPQSEHLTLPSSDTMTGNDASPAHIPTPATELPGNASNDSSVMDLEVKGRSSQDVSKVSMY